MLLVLSLASGCVAAPIRQQSESEEKANLAGVQSAAPSVSNGQDVPTGQIGKAEACLAADPCVKAHGVWLPPDLAAQTAGWGEGLAACKSKLEGCSYVKPEPWVYVLVGVAGAIVGGFAVAGAYEFRDWLKK